MPLQMRSTWAIAVPTLFALCATAAAETPDKRRTELRDRLVPRVELAMRERVERANPDEQLPWIWVVLRREVYTRLPHYERERKFSLVLSPVIVRSPTDSVPGVGVGGEF